MNERRRIVGAYVRDALDALDAGEPIPPAPATDSADVDGRLAALVTAIEEQYRPL